MLQAHTSHCGVPMKEVLYNNILEWLMFLCSWIVLSFLDVPWAYQVDVFNVTSQALLEAGPHPTPGQKFSVAQANFYSEIWLKEKSLKTTGIYT